MVNERRNTRRKFLFALIFFPLGLFLYGAGELEENSDNEIEAQTLYNTGFSLKEELLDYCEGKEILSVSISEVIVHPAYAEQIRIDMEFDGRGNLHSRFVDKTNPRKQSRYIYSYHYDEKGNLVEESSHFTFTDYSRGGEISRQQNRIEQSLYEYDAEGALARITDPRTGTVKEFAYDGQGRLVRMERIKDGAAASSRKYLYGTRGLLDEVTIEYNGTDEGQVFTNVYEYATENDYCIRQYDADSNLVYMTCVEYDSSGNLLAKQMYKGTELAYSFRYEYDSRGNQVLNESKYCGENWGSQWFGRQIREYDSQNRITAYFEYSDDRNPETDEFQLYRKTGYKYEDGHTTVIRENLVENTLENRKDVYRENGLTRRIREERYSRGELYRTLITEYSYDGNRITAETTDGEGEQDRRVELTFECAP